MPALRGHKAREGRKSLGWCRTQRPVWLEDGSPWGHGGRDMVPHGDMEGAQATAQEGQAGQNGPDSMLLALKSQSRASARDRRHLT